MRKKFRIWNNKLIYSDSFVNFYEFFEQAAYNEDSCDQFIGVLDKNGKEIYENDILNICGGRFQVIFKNFKFQLKSLDEENYFMDLNDSTNRFCEVIGNIYES